MRTGILAHWSAVYPIMSTLRASMVGMTMLSASADSRNIIVLPETCYP